ncbi:MAG: SDR family oxidoreductase [Burkholderiales bacterium]|nr:SDR family oxidoreductase [Burkholderiales bacterium]
MDLDLAGKVAIVGGGSDGLGFAMADRLLGEGALVTVFARRAEKVEQAVAELARKHGGERVLGVAADCSEAPDLDRVTASAVARFGPVVHVLVTNDGGPPIRRIAELTDEVWMQALARHFFYVVRSVRATLPHMTAGGSILNVVSGVVQRPAVGMAAPVAVWSAVIGYAKTLALEVAKDNITVNTLMSGFFDTPLLGRTLERQPELTKASLGKGIPMGRIGEPHEFASLVAALVSPNARFVTGLVVPVDGGSSIGMGATFDSPRIPKPA